MEKDAQIMQFSKEEAEEIVYFQKKVIDLTAGLCPKHGIEKTVNIFSMGLCFAIANIIKTFGIKDHDLFMNDMFENLKIINNEVKEKDSGYTVFNEKGKKIHEGSFD